MLSQESLPTFKEVKEQRDVEFYVPGELAPTHIPYSEGIIRGSPWPKIAFDKDWTIPRRVTGIPGIILSPFKPQKSLRRAGKELIYRNLKMLPTELSMNADINPELRDMPQLPLYFMDGVPSFDEVPFGLGNISFGQEIQTERGIWGDLISSLSQEVSKILELEKSKYQTEIQAAQKPLVKTTGVIPGTSSNAILYLLLGGGALFFLTKKKTKKIKRGR